jgi:MoaA/NifB/PqqE/SkfB family radical SAM enzyme
MRERHAWLRWIFTGRGEDRPAAFVVVPSRGALLVADVARHLVDALQIHAQAVSGDTVTVIAANLEERQLWCVGTGHPLDPSWMRRPAVTVLMGPAFLLADSPPFGTLVEKALLSSVSYCGTRSTADAYACAFRARALSLDGLWRMIRLLSACVDDRVDAEWARLRGEVMIPPAETSADNSPALEGIADCQGRRSYDAPVFVNTAFRELLTAPCDRGNVEGRPERMAAALVLQRSVSRVPWVFNTLVNDIEYRIGSTEPDSIPPEVHLSIAGRCNIECRFCAYEHAIARTDVVDVNDVARLDFLAFAQTFRLHSGLGEPTVNRHLPAIVEHVAARFPHLTMNFFTNAVLLDRPRLINALVGNVQWINASLNAATRETWRNVCNADLFDRVVSSLRTLHAAKRARRTLHPLVFGSTVLTSANLDDLPRLPALCRTLGIDRFTAFPYFGLGYHGRDKYGAETTLESCRNRYDGLYQDTVREARNHGISLEIPLPSADKRTAFGAEARPLHDFARIEANQWRLGRFVSHLSYDRPPAAHCAFLWRSVGIGSTNNSGHAGDETHYLYPCLGPLSSLDLSRKTAFRFPGTDDFLQLWRNPIFARLRQAQRHAGVSPVCDACRGCDTRDPEHFPRLERLVAEFAREHCAIPDRV